MKALIKNADGGGKDGVFTKCVVVSIQAHALSFNLFTKQMQK